MERSNQWHTKHGIFPNLLSSSECFETMVQTKIFIPYLTIVRKGYVITNIILKNGMFFWELYSDYYHCYLYGSNEISIPYPTIVGKRDVPMNGIPNKETFFLTIYSKYDYCKQMRSKKISFPSPYILIEWGILTNYTQKNRTFFQMIFSYPVHVN